MCLILNTSYKLKMENKKQYLEYEDEISIKEIFMALWRQKLLIISITLIVSILSGVFSMFILSPVYHSSLNIVINMPEAYHTKYGDYTLPITTNQQYIYLIKSSNILLNTIKEIENDVEDIFLETLAERVVIASTGTTDQNHNNYVVKVSANRPEDARIIAKALYSNYINFLNVFLKEGAVNYFCEDYSIKINVLEDQLQIDQELLRKNQELLAEIPQTINQKEAMQELEGKLNTSEFVVLENIINPSYTKIEQDIILSKQNISQSENMIELYRKLLTELENKKAGITAYYNTGVYRNDNLGEFGIAETNIYLPSDPITPLKKSSPSNVKNILIGACVGGMIAILISLVKEYCFNKE